MTSSAMKRDDDNQALVAALLRGDPDAIETLVDRYGGRIYRIALRLLGNARDAEETSQDVLLTVIQRIGAFRGEASFSSWLYRITANAAYDRLRSPRSRPEVALGEMLPVFDDAGRHAQPVRDWSGRLEDPGVAAEVRSTLGRTISRLPAEYRITVLLRDVEGLSNEEVATTLGLTVVAVKSRLFRARLALRRDLAHFFAASR